MASETDLFQTAIGLLVKKDRAEAIGLKEDEIVREIDYIKFQLNALARSQLLTSITFFREGMLSLFKLFNKSKLSEHHTATDQSAQQRKDQQMEVCTRSDPVITVSRDLKDFKIADLDEEGLRLLSTAKKDFKQARIKATEAFNNEALSPSDRIQAIAIRVAAKILENIDHPDEALPVCRLCLEDLHSLKEVQESFGKELNKGIFYHIKKDERREIISLVCRINRAIYDVTSIVAKSGELLSFPLIDNGRELVNPLHDSRVAQILAGLNVEDYSVKPLSLGDTDGSENKLKIPQGIAAISNGHFIVGDEWDRDVKVFDCNGTYQYSLPCIAGDSSDSKEIASIVDVASDNNDNVYVLVELQKSGSTFYRVHVFKFAKQTECRYFQLRREEGEKGEILRLTVNNNSEILALADSSDQYAKCVVEVYSTTDGHFKPQRFGQEHLKCAQDISVASDGRVIVLDKVGDNALSIHVFDADGKHSFKFKVDEPLMTKMRPSIACYQKLNPHIVMAVPCKDSGKEDRHFVKILVYALQYNKHKFFRSIELQTKGVVSTRGITVTLQGHFAVGLLDKSEGNSRVLVV